MGNTYSQAREIPTAFEVIYNTSHPAKAIDTEQDQYANELLQVPNTFKMIRLTSRCRF